MELEGISKTIFSLIKPQLSANITKYKNGTKPKLNRSEAEANAKQDESQTEGNVNDNVNDKVKEKEKVKADFEIFWNLYDNKTDRKKCFDKWMKLGREEIESILSTVQDFKNHKPFATYTHPNPLTYLNGKRWEDELPTVKKIAPKKLNQDNYFSYGDYVSDCEKAGVTPEPPQI